MKTKKVLYAAAFTGKKFHLYKRIKRLVSHPENSIISGRITSVILVFAVALILFLNVGASMLDNSFYGNITYPSLGHKQVSTDNLPGNQDDTLKISKEEYAAMKAELKIIIEEMKRAMAEFNAQHKEQFKKEMIRAQNEMQLAMEYMKSEEFQKNIENTREQYQQSLIYIDSIRNSEKWQEAMNEVKRAMQEFNEKMSEIFQEYMETMREAMREYNEIQEL